MILMSLEKPVWQPNTQIITDKNNAAGTSPCRIVYSRAPAEVIKPFESIWS